MRQSARTWFISTGSEALLSRDRVAVIATHGLRHSASDVYRANGAAKDDLQKLYGHSSSAVTSRYIHDKGQQLSEVSQKIRVLPAHDLNGTSQNLPKSTASELDDISRVC